MYWLAVSLLLVALATIEMIGKETVITGSILLGLGILLGIRMGRNKEWFSADNPRETI